jgi:3-oxosteroid 1-dehydrogenase
MAAASWDEETDLLVLGSGAAGLTAALVAAVRGLRVILCEKASVLGGTTATSGGAIWIAGSSQAARAGYADSIERGREYLCNELGRHANHELIDAFTLSGPEAVDFLERNTEVQFDVVPLPDYHAETPGGMVAGRVLIAKPYDGRRLGAHFRLLAAPMKRLMVLGGMMVGFAEIPIMIRPLQSFHAFTTTSKILLRYARDRLRHPRGTRLLNGNALVARFMASLLNASASLRTHAKLLELVVRDGRVQGALIEMAGGARRIRALRGVLLATGGAAQRSSLQRDLMRDFPHEHTIATAGATGDGVSAALDAGGAIDRDISSPAVWTPASVMKEKDGSTTVFPYGYLDRGKPGAIAIDANGKRFVNEANSYHDVVQAMYRNTRPGAVPRAHLVCDADFIKRYGLGIIRPHDLTLRSYVRAGYVMKAASLQELAQKIGVDAGALAATIVKHNEFARIGIDADFGKGSTAFNRANGDARVKPNCNLRAIARAPFYALPITPATLGASIGLKTDRNAQVLNDRGEPIVGLYAIGNDATSVMAGYCPGGGVTLGPAVVFAYRAVLHAQAERNVDETRGNVDVVPLPAVALRGQAAIS